MDPEKLMRHIVESFERTDLEPLIEALHDDVVWKSASKQEKQQSKMKTCNADPKAKTLKGDERKAFMKECLSAKA